MNWPSGFCGLGVFSGLKSHTIILGTYHIKDGAHDGFPPGTSFPLGWYYLMPQLMGCKVKVCMGYAL
jgi:hypothetical protein